MGLSHRERFQAIARGQRPGEVMIIDWFHKCLPDTPMAWVNQGAPPEILHRSPLMDGRADPLNGYFDYEHLHVLREIISGLHRLDLMGKAGEKALYPIPTVVPIPIVPVFERKLLEENDRYRVETTFAGQTVRIAKKHPWSMPQYLDHPVKDRATWKEYKWRLDPFSPGRWPSDWDRFAEERNSEDAPHCLLLGGFFGPLRSMTGLEQLLYLFYDDPALVEDMMDTMLHLETEVLRRVLGSLKVEMVRFWEDMAYKTGPMISPAMFKKFLIPRYQKLCDLLHSHGVDLIHVDCDGNIYKLIDPWLEVGINFHWPLEVAAGMDAVALRNKYGRNLILAGNIDKQAFGKGKEAIRQEVMGKVPYLLETGGYFPSLDHNIPPDVPLEGFCYYLSLLKEMAGLREG